MERARKGPGEGIRSLWPNQGDLSQEGIRLHSIHSPGNFPRNIKIQKMPSRLLRR